ncbi:phasin family protein [Haloimpatiens massiliensis]|uniref:phasin family protein n=1 Tax=Haloimpatiens massiliensis TaxID=1658110 RepID=UPI000C823F28|nr:phasin family protein [Haloimpatiens massiliensis]
MKNEIKNIFLAGIGSAAYTYEKASKMVSDLVEKGKLTVEEGKELSEELKRNISTTTETVKEKIENKPLTKEDMASLLKEMNFVSKDEVDNLKQEISKLQEKLDSLTNNQ